MPRAPLPKLAAAGAVLLASIALAACGSDEGSDGASPAVADGGVTTAEGEAAAAAAGAEAGAGEAAAASSDAAQAVPSGNPEVLGAAPGAAGGEAAPATTAPTSGAVDPTTGAPLPAEPGVGGVTGETPNGTTGAPAGAGTPTPAPAPAVATSPTGVTPVVPASPVLSGTEAVLSRPFSADSPWNTPVSGAVTDRRSERWMRLSRIRVGTVEKPNGEIVQQRRPIRTGLTVNVTRWTVPVFNNAQSGAVERITVCRQFDCGPDAVTSVTIPPNACPDPRFDGWMTVIDTTTRTALDFWRARCEADGSISYHYVKRWDLDGPGFQQPGGVSARGSGLPLFAGLITPEEIRDGRIDHALAISVPGAAQRRYVQPASRTDGTGLPNSLPEGARIRLKPGANDLLTRTFVRNGMQRGVANTIISALERYGAIVVDRSAAPTMYAQRNADWTGTLPLNLLQDIGLRQFQVVQSGALLFDPPRSGEATSATALPPGTPGSIPGSTSGSQGVDPGGEFATPDVNIDLGEVIP